MVNAAGIETDGLSFRIGEFTMEGLSLRVRPGEYFVLAGPNGAGKTVLLRLLAGLCIPAAGTITIGGRPVTSLPPWQRNVGYMPQEGVLFPHRTVRRNIEFGLEVRGVPQDEMRERVAWAASLLGIERLLERRPQGLSGGEQQKASLARALVTRPAVLLLDEPLSAIDEEKRDELCRELRRVQQALSITTVHVAHNRRETELVADRVGRMAGGKIEGISDLPKPGTSP